MSQRMQHFEPSICAIVADSGIVGSAPILKIPDRNGVASSAEFRKSPWAVDSILFGIDTEWGP